MSGNANQGLPSDTYRLLLDHLDLTRPPALTLGHACVQRSLNADAIDGRLSECQALLLTCLRHNIGSLPAAFDLCGSFRPQHVNCRAGGVRRHPPSWGKKRGGWPASPLAAVHGLRTSLASGDKSAGTLCARPPRHSAQTDQAHCRPRSGTARHSAPGVPRASD